MKGCLKEINALAVIRDNTVCEFLGQLDFILHKCFIRISLFPTILHHVHVLHFNATHTPCPISSSSLHRLCILLQIEKCQRNGWLFSIQYGYWQPFMSSHNVLQWHCNKSNIQESSAQYVLQPSLEISISPDFCLVC